MLYTYEIITVTGKEFDHDYSFASVIDSWYQNGTGIVGTNDQVNGNDEYVIVTTIDPVDAQKYEYMLSTDSAVISFTPIG